MPVRTMTLTKEGRFLRMMMKSTERLSRRKESRKETVKYIRFSNNFQKIVPSCFKWS